MVGRPLASALRLSIPIILFMRCVVGFLAVEHVQVPPVVVSFLPIDVMDDFAGVKMPFEAFLRNPSVHELVAVSESPVSVVVDVGLCHLDYLHDVWDGWTRTGL